jgi:chemotaxis protein methyltransferase CheR
MHFPSDSLKMSESTFIILRDLIHERVGIYYENHKQDMLADKMQPRVLENGLTSFLDYYYLLKYDTNAEAEWKYLMDALSVPETFFWREVDQIKTLVTVLLPQYLDQCSFTPSMYNPIKIWSAACSTGEEPLTIAIALKEAGWFEKVPITIYASDASSRAISLAKRGIYRPHSFRTLPEHLRDKYFTHEEGGWKIAPEIHRKVQWQVANLLNPLEIEALSHSPFIFCRNVFIYFSENSIRKTVETFFKGMPTPAYLCISSSESLLKLNTKFDLQEINGAFIYVKT